MHPFERFATWLVSTMPYLVFVLFGALFLLCCYYVWYLHGLRGVTALEDGALFRHPRWPMEIRYPSWWEVRDCGDVIEFESGEKDGVLRLRCCSAEKNVDDVRDMVRAALDAIHVALDDPEVHSISVNPYPGAHASSFADRMALETTPDGGEEWAEHRCYAAGWAFRGPKTIAVFDYTCSVLFGSVDGYYHDLMMPTLILDGENPEEKLRTHDSVPERAAGVVGV